MRKITRLQSTMTVQRLVDMATLAGVQKQVTYRNTAERRSKTSNSDRQRRCSGKIVSHITTSRHYSGTENWLCVIWELKG
ncbi:hypothetical protein KCP74_18290 [Salmonella enterica subsp. enterica]|nr:hypothetical protein KCP74_18290 [Salmonella enterica subsp. enterica]